MGYIRDGWMRSKKETKRARALLQAKISQKENKSEISNRKIKSGNEKDDHVPRSFSLSLNTHTQSKRTPKDLGTLFFFFSVSSWEVLASTPSLHYKSLTFHYHQM
jgi:hypothetical protein